MLLSVTILVLTQLVGTRAQSPDRPRAVYTDCTEDGVCRLQVDATPHLWSQPIDKCAESVTTWPPRRYDFIADASAQTIGCGSARSSDATATELVPRFNGLDHTGAVTCYPYGWFWRQPAGATDNIAWWCNTTSTAKWYQRPVPLFHLMYEPGFRASISCPPAPAAWTVYERDCVVTRLPDNVWHGHLVWWDMIVLSIIAVLGTTVMVVLLAPYILLSTMPQTIVRNRVSERDLAAPSRPRLERLRNSKRQPVEPVDETAEAEEEEDDEEEEIELE